MKFDFVIPVLHYDADVLFYDVIARELERQGCTVGLIAVTRRGVSQLRAAHRNVFNLYEGFDESRPVPTESLVAMERKYALNSFNDLTFTERGYHGGTHEKTARRAFHDFRFFERFLEKHDVQFFLNNSGGEIIRRVTAHIAMAGGPRNILIDFAPFFGRVALTTDDIAWDDLPGELPSLAAQERRFIESCVNEMVGGRKSFAVPRPLGINLGSAYRPFVNLARAAFSVEQRDESLAFVYNRRLHEVVRRAFNPRFYELPVPDEPYLFFPLHVPGDSALTLRAPQFHRQEHLVEHLAERALPTGLKLYVKPHPAARDAFSIEMLRRIKRLPDVRLIDPLVNSHDMIRTAKGVVVINSTAGFEGLLYGKPVVTVGRVFYRGFGVTTDVDYLGDLGRGIRTALSSPIPREKTLRFLHAAYQASWPGRFADSSSENACVLGSSLLAKAARLKQQSVSAVCS